MVSNIPLDKKDDLEKGTSSNSIEDRVSNTRAESDTKKEKGREEDNLEKGTSSNSGEGEKSNTGAESNTKEEPKDGRPSAKWLFLAYIVVFGFLGLWAIALYDTLKKKRAPFDGFADGFAKKLLYAFNLPVVIPCLLVLYKPAGFMQMLKEKYQKLVESLGAKVGLVKDSIDKSLGEDGLLANLEDNDSINKKKENPEEVSMKKGEDLKGKVEEKANEVASLGNTSSNASETKPEEDLKGKVEEKANEVESLGNTSSNVPEAKPEEASVKEKEDSKGKLEEKDNEVESLSNTSSNAPEAKPEEKDNESEENIDKTRQKVIPEEVKEKSQQSLSMDR